MINTSKFIILMLIILVTGCVSSKKYFLKNKYDAAINHSVKKLLKSPNKEDEIDILREAYRVANQKSRERISFLKTDGQPFVWDEVYIHLGSIKKRQDSVKRLPIQILNRLNFELQNIDSEIIEARNNAVTFHYSTANQLLLNNNKLSAREAYRHLLTVQKYEKYYRDTNKLINAAKYNGTNYTIMQMVCDDDFHYSETVLAELAKINVSELNSTWISIDSVSVPQRFYDFTIVVDISAIEVSPEESRTRLYTESREIEEGWNYLLDKKGNVKKDSDGNDIKIPVIKVASCHVNETELRKSARVSGSLDFIDNSNNQLIRSLPISAESIFEDLEILVTGDHRSLSPELRKKISKETIPFPDNIIMIINATQSLNDLIKGVVRKNQRLLDSNH